MIRYRIGKKNPTDSSLRIIEASLRDTLDTTLLNPLTTRIATIKVLG